MDEIESCFADEDSLCFYGNGTLSKLLIDFDCLFDGEWLGSDTRLADGILDSFTELRNLGYGLFLYNVPYDQMFLEWLDYTFDYPFICNDDPNRYADTGDHWTTISRRIETKLCPEGNPRCDRNINFAGKWNDVVEIIKENDAVAQTNSASIVYDDIDWNQAKVENGICNGDDKKYFGDSYIPVEKMNAETTEFLNAIAKPRTNRAISYSYKPIKERWYAESIIWDVNEEIASEYGASIEIEQGSLYYRGTWIKVTARAPFKDYGELEEICRKFCDDFCIDNRKELNLLFVYDWPWSEEQKKREKEDDDTDDFFFSY